MSHHSAIFSSEISVDVLNDNSWTSARQGQDSPTRVPAQGNSGEVILTRLQTKAV